MKKKTILSIILVLALLVSAVSIPAFATYNNTFQLSGRIVLPGEDTAPEGGLIVTLEYRTDRGTTDPADDKVTPIIIQLNAGTRETYFSLNMDKTNTGAKYSLSYNVPASSKYWDKGYYSVNGMQYYKAGQTLFDEGTVISNLVITPLRASKISGIVAVPAYSVTQGAIEVDVSAKTTGILAGSEDDYTAETTVNLTNASIFYSLKVPTTAATAAYTVMYETSKYEYVKQGWYSTTGTAITEANASKVDVSNADRSDINMVLVKQAPTATFKLEGKVTLPGTDIAPAGGLTVTLEYRSDKGTPSVSSDDIVTNIAVPLAAGVHEVPFSVDLPYTASGAKYALSYTVPAGSVYWDKGYYTLSGMQYFNDGQKFTEGTILPNLVITPVRASVISGSVGLPSYSTTPGAVTVEVKAKTTGILTSEVDDYAAKTNVSVTNAAVSYSLKVPVTVTSAGYIVMYQTNNYAYEKNGWYGLTGTAIKASDAVKVDVSVGNRSDVNLTLIADPTPEIPSDIDFDLNNDGKIDVKDMVMVARAMGAKHKYVKELDLNKDGVINVTDLKLIKAKMEKFLSKKNYGKNWEKLYGKDFEKYLGQDLQRYLGKNWKNILETKYNWDDDDEDDDDDDDDDDNNKNYKKYYKNKGKIKNYKK